MKIILFILAISFAFYANADQPCAGRASGSLVQEKNHDNLMPGPSANSKFAPARPTNNVKGTR